MDASQVARQRGDQHGRRRVLGGGAALLGLAAVGGAVGGPAVAAGAPASRLAAARALAQQQEPTTLTPEDFEALGACKMVPEQTEGPFYADLGLMRRDLTEGRAGHPLRLGARVVDEACEPIPGALVDIWHCDVDGDYSAFVDGSGGDDEGDGTTFLRGTQMTNDDGIVEFHTNYPGWYTGRAVHIHTKAHLEGGFVRTTQLYLPEEVTDQVHAQEPYAAQGTRDTRNEQDFIAGDPAANGNLLATSADGAGTLGLVVLGVDAEAAATQCNWFEQFWYLLTGQWERCWS
jgi:protocatechuate 3,4-dioxygenase beta subunit